MKTLIIIGFLLPIMSCSQSSYDRTQNIKIDKATSDIVSLKAAIVKIAADTVAKGKRIVALEKSVKLLQDSINYYKGWLSSDLSVDKKKIITIPKLKMIDSINVRVTKLEAKR